MNMNELEIGKDYAVGHARKRGTCIRVYRTQDYRSRPVKYAEFRMEDGQLLSFAGKDIPFTWEEQEVFNKQKEEQAKARQELEAENRLAEDALKNSLKEFLGEPKEVEFEIDTNNYRRQVIVRLSLANAHKLAGTLVAAELSRPE